MKNRNEVKGTRNEESLQSFNLDPRSSNLSCEDCGEQIPEGRRRAIPGCKRCMSCQTEFEKIHIHWRAL
ncbi:MAG: TraR/DksA C4-type zinc finger protein [Pseudomonadota bacterium]